MLIACLAAIICFSIVCLYWQNRENVRGLESKLTYGSEYDGANKRLSGRLTELISQEWPRNAFCEEVGKDSLL